MQEIEFKNNKLDVLKENFELREENEKLKKQLLSEEGYKKAFTELLEFFELENFTSDYDLPLDEIVETIQSYQPKMYK